MRVWLLIYIIILAFAAQKDYIKYKYAQNHVHAFIWICYKTNPVGYEHTKAWNQSLFLLPGVVSTPYKSNKPIEHLFASLADTVLIPYSPEAASLILLPEWKEEDKICLYVDDISFLCNLFQYCLFWPLVAPLKLIFS